MAIYTLDTLQEINASYDNQHGVNLTDVEEANELVAVIEFSRKLTSPQIGDIVQFTSKHGDYYANAHIERVKSDELYICERPHIPFTSVLGNRFSTDTSGGAWKHIPANLKHVGTEEKAFYFWGHGGARANGAVRVLAEVNVWEYVEGEPEFSTKNHSKFHVNVREPQSSTDYKYVVTKDHSPHTAFKTEEEYQAWLKTYQGVEKDGNWDNERIVWTLKQSTQYIPLTEYNDIAHAVIDSELMNGCIQECKRVYEGTTVSTYMPFQHEKIELSGQKH